MSLIKLPRLQFAVEKEITLPSSKSISNRLLILQFLSGNRLNIQNLSNADDTQLLNNLLSKIEEGQTIIDCKNAGTTFRFLLSVLCVRLGNWQLTGSARMQQRPIADLVEALQQLGANIDYTNQIGFPPLSIKGNPLLGGRVEVRAGLSSQYISSLMLIAPFLPEGLEIQLQGEVSSKPYIALTQHILETCGVGVCWEGNTISVLPSQLQPTEVSVESDWSAASYFYGMVALGENTSFYLKGLAKNTLQGDGQVLPAWFEKLGVETHFTNEGAFIKKSGKPIETHFEQDFTHCPDLAQTFAVCCAGLGISAKLTGLESLKIKETNRLEALHTELLKLNVNVKATDNSLEIISSKIKTSESVKTYGDHRMAMAFAMLATKYDNIQIENPEVVEKSFPYFWREIGVVL